jgi:hypothetical protein
MEVIHSFEMLVTTCKTTLRNNLEDCHGHVFNAFYIIIFSKNIFYDLKVLRRLTLITSSRAISRASWLKITDVSRTISVSIIRGMTA